MEFHSVFETDAHAVVSPQLPFQPQLQDLKPCHYSTKNWVLLASSSGTHLLPNHSSFPSHHFQHWGKAHGRGNRTSKPALLLSAQQSIKPIHIHTQNIHMFYFTHMSKSYRRQLDLVKHLEALLRTV